jgi:PAS domain S-box-containing protein
MTWTDRIHLRPRFAVLGAGCLEAAISISLGAWYSGSASLGAVLGILVAVFAGLAGGPAAGGVTATLGWGLFFLFVSDTVPAALGLPAWVVAAVAAGLIADRLRRARTERGRLVAELATVRGSVREAIVTVDSDGTILDWNAHAEDLYGYTSEEAVGRPVTILSAGEGDAELLDLIASVGEGGSELRRAVHRRKDGSETVLALAVACVRDPSGPGRVTLVGLDVGERERLKARACEFEVKYRALVERLPLVSYVYAVGRRDRLSYVSPQLETMLGYSPEQLLAEPGRFERLLHPDDRERVTAAFAAADRSPDPVQLEYRLLSRGGGVVWVRDEFSAVRDDEGRPAYTQGYLIDVTAQHIARDERGRLVSLEKRALAEAAETQRRLDLLAEAGDVLTSSLDYQKTLERVARLVTRELADWCTIDLVEEDGSISRIVVAHAEPRSGGPASMAGPASEPEGTVVGVIRSGQAVLGGDGGEPTGEASQDFGSFSSYVCVPLQLRRRALGALTLLSRTPGRSYDRDDLLLAREVAQRAALALENGRLYAEVEARAEAAHVLAYVGDGVFLLDRSGIVRLWNAAAEAITGLRAAAVLGRAPAEAVPGWRAIVDRIPLASSPENQSAQTIPIETPDGERWISISGVEFFGGTIYAFRDFTEEHRLEEVKAEFVATASHELRTPLAAVYGAAQTLRRHDFALDEGGRERFLSLIVDESERLGRIVNEILLANQLEGGRLDFVTEAFDPVELVERVTEAARTHAPPNISLEIVAPPAVPPVAADREKVRQVLVNLVENAIKYSPDGGKVEIGAEPEPEEGMVRFSVADEGLGIPADERERIFEKFYRLDPHMSRGIGGTGLGLYICAELVTRMGGHISVESSDGGGSIFIFELPLAETLAPSRANREANVG